MKKQILKNLSSTYIFGFLGMGLGFFLVPFLLGKLGKEAYGLVVLAESTAAFFEILTISIRMSLSRHATFALSRQRMDELREYLSTGRIILYVSSVCVLVLSLWVSTFFSTVFRVPSLLSTDCTMLFLLISLSLVVSIPNIVFWSILYAKQRFDLINLSMSLGISLRAILIFLYYIFAPAPWRSLTAYGVIYFLMTCAQNYLTYRWSRIEMPEQVIQFRFFRRERIREILSFSLHTSLSRISSLLYQETAHILINILWGPAYNAIYSISLKLPNMMRKIFIEPSWALTPTFTDLVAKNDRRRMETLLFLYSKILTILTLPLCLALFFFAEPIIAAWVGPEFMMAGKLLPLFSISLFVGIPFSLSGCLVNAFGKVKIPSIISLVTALVNLALCILLGHWFSWKLFGIAWANIIASLLIVTLFYPIYACRISGISIRRYCSESWVKPLGLAMIMIGIEFWAFRSTPYGTQLNAVMVSAVLFLSIGYYLGAFFLLFNTEEKVFIRGLLRPSHGKR